MNFAVVAAPGFMASAGAGDDLASIRIAPAAEQFTLENGMDVVVIPDTRVPVVTHMVWYRAGAADERPGVSGVAHFLEHLLFKGTFDNPGDTFSTTVARLGGSENAFTSYDYTAYFQRVAREHLPLVMRLEADRMRNLDLSEDVIAAERNVILEERASRTDNDPSARLREMLSAALYQNHPYGIPVIGWEHEMAALSREDALAFYRQYYAPENAILVVAGDVSADEVRSLAEQTYGTIARVGETLPRRRPQEPVTYAERRVTLADAHVARPSLDISFLAPSYTTDAGAAAALDVLSQILGGGPTSRLYRQIVVEDQLATSAGTYFQGTSLDPSSFGFYGEPRPGVSVEALEEAFRAQIDKLLADGVSEEEVALARRSLIADAIFSQDNQATLARIFGASLAVGETMDMVQNWPAAIAAVTPDAILEAARTVLDRRRSAVGILLPEPAGGRS